jgi:hypothetical protein
VKLYRPVGGVVEAVQWNGTNDAEVLALVGDGWSGPLPPVGSFIVRRAGGIAVYNAADFAANYQPAYDF